MRIYIYREREREKLTYVCICVYIAYCIAGCLHIYCLFSVCYSLLAVPYCLLLIRKPWSRLRSSMSAFVSVCSRRHRVSSLPFTAKVFVNSTWQYIGIMIQTISDCSRSWFVILYICLLVVFSAKVWVEHWHLDV